MMHQAPFWQLVLSTPVVLWAGFPFFQKGFKSFQTRNWDMFTLISIGTGAAYLFSLAALFFPEFFPTDYRLENGSLPVYFEAAAVITTLVLLGQVLEMKSKQKTSQSIEKLMELTPPMATIIRNDGTEDRVSLGEVQVGDHLRVRPGEKIPTDGTLLEGAGSLDESMLSGETMLMERGPNERLLGGTLLTDGSFVMRADHVGKDTLISRIIAHVQEAQNSKAPISRLADRVASIFVPSVVSIGVLAGVLWLWLGPQPSLPYAVLSFVSVLIIACPCALGLATPVSITVAMGKGALEGILTRDAAALERFQKVDVLITDKTGTLTEGRPELVSIHGDESSSTFHHFSSLASQSEHPLAKALAQAARKKENASFLSVSDFSSKPGQGIRGVIQDQSLLLGSLDLLKKHQVSKLPTPSELKAWAQGGKNMVLGAINSEFKSAFMFADVIKETSSHAIQSLREQGVEIFMATGDRKETAEEVGKQLGITEIHFECRPEDKYKLVKDLQAKGHIVAMAGDGTNDAPALAQADVGIAMGQGTDIAMETAPITLIRGDLAAIAKAQKLSHLTLKNIRQNLFFAFIYNGIGIPIAAGVLYPWFGILLHPMLASIAMSLSSVSVISNALRLRRIHL